MQRQAGKDPDARQAAIVAILARHAGDPGVDLKDSADDLAHFLVMMLPVARIEHLLEFLSESGRESPDSYRPLAEELVAWQDQFLDG